MRPGPVFIPLVALLIGCGGVQPTDDMEDRWKGELMEADRAFAEAVSTDGLSRWGSFFTSDGTVIQEGVGEIHGAEAIQASMDAAAEGGFVSLTWMPERAEVSSGGDLGYTLGTYRSTGRGPDGAEMVSSGMYVSIWRRQEDGSWKVEMDLGNVIIPPEPVSSEQEPGG